MNKIQKTLTVVAAVLSGGLCFLLSDGDIKGVECGAAIAGIVIIYTGARTEVASKSLTVDFLHRVSYRSA